MYPSTKTMTIAQQTRRIGFALLAIGVLGGCAPHHVRWRDASAVVEPQGARAATRPEPRGYLVIAMRPGSDPGDEEMERYPPVYLYDRDGRFLTQLPNNTEYPQALRSGDYIVLVGEADPLGPFRQLQVRVEDGRTTSVSLAEIEHAPWR